MRKKFSIIGMTVCSLIIVFGIVLVAAESSDSEKAAKLIAYALLSGISGYRMIGFGLFGFCLFGALTETPKAPTINIPQINMGSKAAPVSKRLPEKELKAQEVAREMQMKMGGISEESPTSTEKKSVKKEINTLPEMLVYAGKFSSDSGMIEYLKREKVLLSEEDRVKVEELLHLPPKVIREAITKLSEKA